MKNGLKDLLLTNLPERKKSVSSGLDAPGRPFIVRSQQGLSRRTLLRGFGTLMALPMLEAMAPTLPGELRSPLASGHLRGQAVTPPRRIIFYYVPNGIVMEKWKIAATGSDFALSPILQPLQQYQQELLILSNLDCYPATDQGDGAGDHARGTGSFLTATHVKKTSGEDIQNDISVDQVIANSQAGLTRYRSLELGVEPGASAGACDSGYSCAYSTNIAWSNPNTPVAKETDPRALFDRLFAGADPNQTEEQATRRLLHRRSILDFVLEDANALAQKVGSSDRQKLDQYLTGVRELETRLELEMEGLQACDAGEAPVNSSNLEVKVQQMSDLMVLAMQCDMTRVFTFMNGNAGSNRSFPFLNIYQSHHELSHHQGDPVKLEKLEQINVWEVTMVKYLLDKMKLVQEGEGSLLDNALVVFGSEIADGNAHGHLGLPVMMAGRLGGMVSPGRHVAYASGTPIANLYMGLAQRFGVTLSSFGDDGTEPLGELG